MLGDTGIADDPMCAENEFGTRVQLIVANVGPRLQPDPFLAFGQEAIIARCYFTSMRYCKMEREMKRISVIISKI